jgi:hypothetical protein
MQKRNMNMAGPVSLHQGNRALLLIALLACISIVDGGVFKGSVIDGSTQLPMPNALLELYTMDSAVTLRFTGNSKTDGSFFYDSIPDQRYFLKITGANYVSQWFSPKGTTRYLQYGIWIGPASDFINIVLLPVPIDNPPSSVVSVTVRDSSGILVTNGMIQLQNEQDQYTVAIADLTTNQGKVSFGNIQPGRYTIFIQSPPYQPQYYDTLLNTTSPRYYVTIAPYDTVAFTVMLTGQPVGNGRLTGKVMAETGQLAPDVFVGLFSSANISLPRYQTKTDAAGIFGFNQILEQPYLLKLGSGSTYPEQWFSPQRHVTTRYPDDPVYPTPTNDTFYITLSANPLDNSPVSVLFLSVLDSMGMAMTSTGTVKCTDRLSTSVKQLSYDPASSMYKIDGLTAGEYSLRIEFPPYPIQYYSPNGATAQVLYYQPITDKDTIVLEVRLKTMFGPVDTTDREIRFDGTVTALSTAQPIPGARVLALPANTVPADNFNPSMLWSSAMAVTDAAGYYVMRNCAAGEYAVAVVVDSLNFVAQFYQNADRLSGARIVRIDSVNRPTVNFQLRQGGVVTGSIKSAGKPVSGVYVQINEKNGQQWFEDSTDANGVFRFTGLPAGIWNFWVYHSHYLRKDIETVSPEVTVTEGKVMTVPDITMEPGGRITGAFTAPFSLLDSMNPGNIGQGRFIGNLLFFSDSLLTKETINYPRHTSGVEVYCNTADPSSGVFVSDVCPQGTWRAVFQPVFRQGNDTAPPPFKSWLGWQVLGGDSVLDGGSRLEIKAFDTVKNITLPLGKGYGILGEMRDSAGAVMNVYNVSAMVKSAGRYFCIAFSERPYPAKFILSGLNSGHDYYLNIWADGYPNQFWSPETTTVQPLRSWHFDTAAFVPLSIRPRRQFADSEVTPNSRPISLSGKFSTSGALQELSWTINQQYAFDSCALFARTGDSVTVMVTAVLVQQGVTQFSAAALPATAGPVRYVAVAKGAGVMVKSDEVYYDQRNVGIAADSLWIAVHGTRWNVRIDWGPLPQFQGDSVNLYRRLAGGPWNLIERRPSWNSVLEDHKWDRADSGKTYEYRVELSAAGRMSGIAKFKLDAQFFANLIKPVYVGPYEKYLTIQSAIDAVESGGMVVVRSGTYRENITFRGKALFLESDWQFGKPPIIDAGGGIAISASWCLFPDDDARPHISGFKIVNAATGIQTSIPLYANQCLFMGVTRAFETIIDSAAMVDALRREPFLKGHIDAGLDQCTFVAGRSGSLVAIANARGSAESPGSSVSLPQGYEKLFIMPVYSLSSSVGISNSLIVNYFSVGGCVELPVKLGGTTPDVYVSDGNFWNTATTISTPRITLENNVLTLDPRFIDTLYYFLPDNSPLRLAASDRRVIGYDGRRFEGGGDNDGRAGPTAVKNLSVRILGLKKVLLAWTASPDTEHVVRYVVYRCPGDTSLFYVNQEKQWEPKLPDSLFMTIVDSFSTTACSRIDSNMVPGVPYLYVVAAIDSAGREGPVDLPASTPLASLIINKYRHQLMLKGQQWHMISPWGADTVAVGASSDVTIYHWDDSRSADKVLSNYVAMNALTPSKGYWFWSERDTILSVAPATLGLLASREDALSISCSAGRTGWNQIASPLPYPIKPPWLDTVAAWEWRADSLGYARATVLEPWKAYWVHTTSSRILALRTDQPAGKRASSDIAWRLQLALSGTGAWDPENYAGVALHEGDAVAGIDEVLEPPAGFNGSQLYFIKNAGSNQPAAAAATRYSSLFATNTAHSNETMEWRVAVSAAQEETRIQIKGIESLPAEFHAFWIDRFRVIDLRKNAAVTVAPHGQEISGYLVVTANPNAIALYSNKLTLNPAWPNPFGRNTNLSYVVPYDWLANGARAPGETRRVCIAIYDIRGRKIATLVGGAVAVGMHRTVWRGDDDNGNTVQSGVYIVRMTSNKLHATSRIFKIK